jgi:hypothetical protein
MLKSTNKRLNGKNFEYLWEIEKNIFGNCDLVLETVKALIKVKKIVAVKCPRPSPPPSPETTILIYVLMACSVE